MKMLICVLVVISSLCFAKAEIKVANVEDLLQKASKPSSELCQFKKCPIEGQNSVCGFDAQTSSYKLFPSKCALTEYSLCYKVVYTETPIEFCVKEHSKALTSRRSYGMESCPVFCPSHYRPVCGASKFKSYAYRAFNNGCYMDMLNCRGEDEDLGYVEVPLEFCQRHAMKNIFKEQILINGVHDYRDYH
ncbi:hypothetical protein NE865_09282 [Phthorimaea operculella]|nr:hypothetical protein NE865_09282 [Phthorimaea operculella]